MGKDRDQQRLSESGRSVDQSISRSRGVLRFGARAIGRRSLTSARSLSAGAFAGTCRLLDQRFEAVLCYEELMTPTDC